ncbi:hypothetical protein, partial [Hungatella effluvii]|uniref:hypothetical protein n=1 Tax=Hungatella effluvii TaxID=1096246 RepID=UPI003A95B2A6
TKKQKGEGARERVRTGTIPLMSKDTSLHVQFMNLIHDTVKAVLPNRFCVKSSLSFHAKKPRYGNQLFHITACCSFPIAALAAISFNTTYS